MISGGARAVDLSTLAFAAASSTSDVFEDWVGFCSDGFRPFVVVVFKVVLLAGLVEFCCPLRAASEAAAKAPTDCVRSGVLRAWGLFGFPLMDSGEVVSCLDPNWSFGRMGLGDSVR